MCTAYLLTGSNLGNRVSYLNTAAQYIQQRCGVILKTSSFYQTAAWGFTEQPDFYNQVIALQTQLPPGTLMQTLLDIEQAMGRKRDIKMGPRIIDIDILLIDDMVINTPMLTVPHPFLAERRFALAPLAEIAPAAAHPVLHKTVQQLLDDCPDTLSVNKIS
ncbi:MAG TPA: 2-amino-4-hydroxy-6-hydroxymethyldihydropteridine diphosphokinase [Chitinophagaceae bacterium]|jgi:2-amino-4-hydroxy-6-hydroxymethyldihydropteridine diphosphokinase|nr:2-amino-4-hydroxy-6-hydroxymethyldihydropteridine diphosphokinase [Chitinophagaceae bacterium]